MNFSVTFACFNQLDYTKMCVDSLIKTNFPMDRLVIVNNASTDNTQEYLSTLKSTTIINNNSNLGCGVAWDQGILAQQSEWTIIMNNDVVVSENWIQSLISTAEKNNLKIISPALIEGDLDYDFEKFSQQSSLLLKDVIRLNFAHAVCMAVHSSVWSEIGYFAPVPSLWGYEDTLFFHQARKAGIKMAITGSSWLHHFGSITVSAMKKEKGLKNKQGLSSRYNYRLLNQNTFTRKLNKFWRSKTLNSLRTKELKKFDMTVHGIRKNNSFTWL